MRYQHYNFTHPDNPYGPNTQYLIVDKPRLTTLGGGGVFSSATKSADAYWALALFHLVRIELVAHALNGLDVVVAHFLAHFAHVHVHGAGQHEHVVAPDILE